jgi:hypothetical protein
MYFYRIRLYGAVSRHCGLSSEDNQGTSDNALIANDDSIICCLNPTGTVETINGKAVFSQWITGTNSGMRINWTTVPSAQFYITVMFLGGDDITNVDIGTLMTGTGTGNLSVTSLSYTGDYGILMMTNQATLNSPVGSGSVLSLGMATGGSGSVNQWCQSSYCSDSGTSVTRQSFSNDRIIFTHSTAVSAVASFSGFNSTGFTINISDAFPGNYPIFWLVMKGGAYSVGNDTEPANTGVQTITNNKNNEAIMIFGNDAQSANTITTGKVTSIGMGTGSGNQYVYVDEDVNSSNTSIVVSRLDSNQIYLNITANATATNSTLDDEAAIDNLSNGSFGINWTNIGNARPFRYATFGTNIVSVTKSLTLKFEGNQLVTKQLTLKQDIRNEISKSLTLRNDINAQVIKRLRLRQNIGDATPPFRSAVVSVPLNYSNGSQDITFSQSPSWTPKAAIITMSRQPTSEDTFFDAISYNCCFIANETRSWGFVTRDASTPNTYTESGYSSNPYIFYLRDPAGVAITSNAQFTQWLTNGMRINVISNQNPAVYVNVMFLGGDDLEAAAVGTINWSTGVSEITVDTLTFDPNLLFLGGSYHPSGYTVGNHWFSFGVANATNQWCIFESSSHNAAAGSPSTSIWNNRISQLSSTGTMVFDSFITNGFKIDVTDGMPSTYAIFYLALKCGQNAVGYATEPSALGAQKITTGNQTDAALIIGSDCPAFSTTYDEGMMSIGMVDGEAKQFSEAIDEVYNADPTAPVSRHSAKVYQNIEANATAANSTVTDEAEALFLDDTGFALDWTKVGSGRIFLYVTIGRKLPSVTKTLTLIQNISSEISKSTTLKFDLYQETTKILNLLYNVEGALASVTKTLNLLFSVNTPITKTTTISWDILEEVSRELTIIFEGAGKVTKSLTLIQNILQETTKTTTIRFGINTSVEKTLTLLFSGLVEATKSLSLLFNGIGQITKTLTLRFDELQEVTRQLTLRFDEMGQITKTLTLRYDVLQETEKSLTLRFDTLKEITKSLTLRQDIIGQITKVLTLLYNVESATLTATKSLTLLFSGIGQTTKSTTVRFDISTIISRTLTLRQDIRTEIERLLTLKFNTEEEVTKSTTLLFSIIQQITKTLTLRNDILSETTKSLTLRNDILTEALKTITLRQNILQEAVKSLSLRFGIEGPIVKTLTLRFDVIAETTKSITLKFNILQDVTKQVNLLFSIIGQATKSLTIPFSIEAEVTKTVTLIQNIVGEVLRTVTLRFDVLKETSKSLTLRQDIIQETTKSVTLRQNILSEVEKDVTILYGILQEVPIVSKTLRFNIEQQITKQLRLLSDIQAQTTKQLRIRFDVKSILIKNMAEKLLDCVFNRYTLALPTKSSILWHEWYNGQNDICISCLPMTVIPIERESTMVYKKRHYVCSLHLFYRHVVDNPNENTPTQLANLTRHIHNLLLANRFNPNFLGAVDAKAVEVRIRDADYIPDPDERGTGVPSPRIYHYRWILEIVYHKIV